jgi:hypothetical protein
MKSTLAAKKSCPSKSAFTFREIELRLQLAAGTRAIPDSPDFTNQLMRVTLCLPLAVGALLNLHTEGDSVLDDLPAFDTGAAEELNRDEAVRTVYGLVAGRFLLHLDGRADRADDLRDITALALLRKASGEVLARLWNTDQPKDRILQLARRYELLANGDLHQRVKEFLRRHWRNEPPDRRRGIATRLLDALEQIRPRGAGGRARSGWEKARPSGPQKSARARLVPPGPRSFGAQEVGGAGT